MKDLFCFLSVLVGGMSSAWAETMCVRDDTVAVVLSETMYGTGEAYNNDAMTWSSTFSTGTIGKISGIASCNSTSGTKNQVSNSNFSTDVTGGNCWCKMTKPAISKWVYYAGYNVSDCNVYCTRRCAALNNINDYGFRRAMFNGIIQ